MKDLTLTRRQFLKVTAAAGMAGLLPGLGVFGNARAASSGDRVLVVVHLHGGNDHLNTLVPHEDGLYYQYRPTLALPAETLLPLAPGLGLHPSLQALQTLYEDGSLAIVHGVGYPEFNRSHFRAIDIYEGADPVGLPATGWLGRYLDQGGVGGSLDGVCVGHKVPLSLRAVTTVAPAIPDADSYTFQAGGPADDISAQVEAMIQVVRQPMLGHTLFDGVLAQDGAALESIALVRDAVASYQSPVVYADEALSQNLRLAAQLIQANIGVRVLSTELNGFDTHADQLDTHAALLANVAAATDSFIADARAGGFSDRVVVLLFSEFGRRVGENASGGTDHGTSAPMFVLGDAVQGGQMLGEFPSLADLDDTGDLKMTTDFRSVYATLLAEWLGVDPVPILGADWPRLALF